MADRRTRELERRAEKEGSPELVALLIGEKVRERADDAAFTALLRRFVPGIRHAALTLTNLTEDQQALLEVRAMIEDQVSFALENAIQPSLVRDAARPLPEVVLASVLKILTPAQATEILQFKEAKLVITPVTSVERYDEELSQASITMEESLVPEFSRFPENQLTAQAARAEVRGNRIKSWKFAITEGAQIFDMPEWDNGQETHLQRIERFNERFVKIGMTRLEFQSYIGLMIQGLRQGKPIDCKYLNHSRKKGAQHEWQYTLMNETDEEIDRIGTGLWDSCSHNVNLLEDNLDYPIDFARFRPAVVGDIEI